MILGFLFLFYSVCWYKNLVCARQLAFFTIVGKNNHVAAYFLHCFHSFSVVQLSKMENADSFHMNPGSCQLVLPVLVARVCYGVGTHLSTDVPWCAAVLLRSLLYYRPCGSPN